MGWFRRKPKAAPLPTFAFRAEIDGVAVFEETVTAASYPGAKVFPPHLLERPSGRKAKPVYLYVNDVCIGRQISLEDEAWEASTGKLVD